MQRAIPSQVLIVEDEPLIRMVAADALCDEGIMAVEAATAEEAIVILNDNQHIALVFTDVDLPGGMSGLDLAQQVSAERPDINLIITSGAANVPEECVAGSGVFLPKPYPTTRLVSLVIKKLEQPAEQLTPSEPAQGRSSSLLA